MFEKYIAPEDRGIAVAFAALAVLFVLIQVFF